MRIVVIGSAYPLRGGIAHYTALLYRILKKRGHVVRVFSFKRQYPKLFFPGKTQMDEGEELIPIESDPVLDTVNPVTWIRAVVRLRRIRPDLLVFKYWMPFFAPCYTTVSRLAKLFLGCPAIFITHNVIPHERRPGDRLLTRIALAGADAFIVHSQAVGDDLHRLKPRADCRRVPHPVYTIFPPALPKKKARELLGIDDERVILFFGFIRRYKGLRYLLEAMPRIWAELPVRLVIAGEFYEDEDESKALISAVDGEGLITLHDTFISNEHVARFFCAADAVVLPYVTATQSGIVQIAYNYNVPVIVTKVGGLHEVVLDGLTGFTVPPEDGEAVAGAVLRFYREKREPAFARRIEAEKENYSWDRLAETVEDMGRRLSAE
ncbi:glycosyltransferase [bacterium]|nr:glycosyltransferase [bacterium]